MDYKASNPYEACFIDFLEFLDISNKELISHDELEEDEALDIQEILEETYLNHSVMDRMSLLKAVHNTIEDYKIHLDSSYYSIYDFEIVNSYSYEQFKKEVVCSFLNIGYEALSNLNVDEYDEYDDGALSVVNQVFSALYPGDSYPDDTNNEFINALFKMIVDEKRSLVEFFITEDNETHVAILVAHEFHF